MVGLGLPDEKDRASEQLCCASFLAFRTVVAGELEGETRLTGARFCKQRGTCPQCDARRAVKMVTAYEPKLLELRLRDSELRFYFCTGTVRNQENLVGAWDALDATLGTWRDTLSKQRRRGRGELSNVAGGLVAIETKRSERMGGWHPHSHMLIAARGRLDYHAMRAAWVKSSAGASEHFYCRELRSEHMQRCGIIEGEAFVEQLRRDLCEVIKYPLKFEPGRALEVWDIARVIRGRRLSRPFGNLVGVEVSDELIDEPLDWDQLEWIDRWFRYQAGARAYKEVSVRSGLAAGEVHEVQNAVPF